MAKEVFNLVTEEEQQYDEIMYKIQNGLLTQEEYANATPAQQLYMREVLFDAYTKNTLNAFASLSALEFVSVGLAKLFFAMVPAPEDMDPTLKNYYDQLKAIVNTHNMPIIPNTWQLGYLQNQISIVMQNRAEYKAKREAMTGIVLPT